MPPESRRELPACAGCCSPEPCPPAAANTSRSVGSARATVALVGNPNTGKTTVFNRLTGLRQRVGNYPGVTVEKKEGLLRTAQGDVRIVDLPGTYSLAAHSPDEQAAVDVLLGQQEGEASPDLVVQVVDASNLERNLYLYSQLRETGLPVVLALNMMDLAGRRGLSIDAPLLSKRLGAPVALLQAHRGSGIAELKGIIAEELAAAGSRRPAEDPASIWPPELRDAVEGLRDAFGGAARSFEILRAIVDGEGYFERKCVARWGDPFRQQLRRARESFVGPVPLPSREAQARYAWIRTQLDTCLRQSETRPASWTDRLDRVLTHKVFGLLIFASVLLLLFQAMFSAAAPAIAAIEALVAGLGRAAAAGLAPGPLQSLLVNGVIAGVGSVLVFLPQILVLFFFIGLLEDCGYMARAAFLMDKLMSKCGLSGKSFIPMLSGFACAVPAILATRVIENRRDRLATMLVIPLITCSARLPVYSILIAAFIPRRTIPGGLLGSHAATLFGLYLLGVGTAVLMAWVFKRTLLRGATPPFLLELPSYKLPSIGTVLYRVYGRAKTFITQAGTIILAIAVIVWGLAYFPHPDSVASSFRQRREAIAARHPSSGGDGSAERLREELASLEREEAGAYLRQSFFARAGRAVEPFFRPLGWDWKISMAVLASFPAREVVIATLGTIYNISEAADDGLQLRERLRQETWPDTGERVFTIPVVLSILVFFALGCQCSATVATIRRESGSWGWPLLTLAYMTVLAYGAAFAAYQIGSLF